MDRETVNLIIQAVIAVVVFLGELARRDHRERIKDLQGKLQELTDDLNGNGDTRPIPPQSDGPPADGSGPK